MILMIDNYDSFTYNLVQYFAELGAEVEVVRNDQVTVDDIKNMAPDQIVISPGPCSPNEAGISMDAIRAFAGKIPLLGICLGHQCIGQVYGGDIIRAPKIMHGKTSAISHHDTGVFAGLPQGFQATRYHSLVIDPQTLPESLEVTAWVDDVAGSPGTIMGVRHKHLAVEGIQFHPESILTEFGHDMLRQFLVANRLAIA